MKRWMLKLRKESGLYRQKKKLNLFLTCYAS